MKINIYYLFQIGLQGLYEIVTYSLCVLVVFGCNMTSKQEAINISGAYRLGPAQDKANTTVSDGVDKFRVYAKDYYICASINTADSVTSFEIGTYKIVGKKLKEHIINGSRGSTHIDSTELASEVHKSKQGLQIITDSGASNEYQESTIENYDRLEEGPISIYDGAWNQLDSYSVARDDTTSMRSNYNFKIIYDGYYIWGALHKFPDTPEHETYWGIGTFEMKGDSIMDERYIMSTLPWVKEGSETRVYVEFINDDTFKQTIHDSDNNIRYIEIYQRIESSDKYGLEMDKNSETEN